MVLALVTFALGGSVRADSAESAFQAGITAFQKKDLATARASFQSALKSDPDNSGVLYNLGLTEEKDGHPGLALALWRKALLAHPDFAPARHAIRWTTAHLEHAEIPHEVELWETLRGQALVTISLAKYLFVTAALLLAAGWLLLRYVGLRRRARLDETPLPGFPVAGVFAATLLVITFSLSVAKAIDLETLRGTIVAKKIEARSSPEAEATPLFDLFEGLEVIVRQTRGDWVQVNYPGGSTGWIPRSAIFTTDDTTKDTAGEKANP